jgi:hypothetical protein
MERQALAAPPSVGALLIVSWLSACAQPPAVAVAPERDGARVGGDRQVTLEARPSPAAAESLAIDVRYRVVLANDGTLALALVSPDRRVLGRLAVAAGIGPFASPGVLVEFEDTDGRSTRVEAWPSAGGLHGHAFVHGRSAHWQVRHEADGSLAGEAWSLPHRDAMADDELRALQRARVMQTDLGTLAAELALDEYERCVLIERLALAELALELSIRAWNGRGRAHLPTIGMPPLPPACRRSPQT